MVDQLEKLNNELEFMSDNDEDDQDNETPKKKESKVPPEVLNKTEAAVRPESPKAQTVVLSNIDSTV